MAAKFEITSFVELLVVHKALHVARFTRDQLVPALPGSPYFADVARRVMETLGEMELERGNLDRAKEWDWKQWRVSLDSYLWQIVVSNAAHKGELWNRQTHEEKINAARVFLSPSSITDEEAESFVREVDERVQERAVAEAIGILVDFRIYGAELDPARVTDLLNLMPDHVHTKGSYPQNDPNHPPYKHGMWSLRSSLEQHEPLAEHVRDLLYVLEPKREPLLKLREENQFDFFCSTYWLNSAYLDPHLLQRVGNIRATLGIAVHPTETIPNEANYLTT
jgi:hypothetical protein